MMTLKQELHCLVYHSDDLSEPIADFLERTIITAAERFGEGAHGPWTATAMWNRWPSRERTCTNLRDAVLVAIRYDGELTVPHRIKITYHDQARMIYISRVADLDQVIEHDLSPGDDPKGD